MTSQISGYIGKYKTQDNVIHSLGSTAYGYCQTAAATADKVVDMTGFTLSTGATIFVKFQYANTAASATLNVNNTGAKLIKRYGTTAPSGTTAGTSGQWSAGAVVTFTYDGTNWIMHYWHNSTYTLYTIYSTTAADTADKVGSGVYFQARKGYFQIVFRYDNTVADNLTLNIASTGALPIYINGVISSSTNYSLLGGYYIGYCSGNAYYFNTDGTIPFLVEEAPQDDKYYARKNGEWIDITSMLNI